jgi:Skp family chaperone for outer membrane proteins
LGVLAWAQGPGGVPQGATTQAPSKPGTSVAVVDIKFIFDNMQNFKTAMDRIRQENEEFEAHVRETETVLRKKLEELKAMTPGTEPFQRLEEEIAKTRTQVQLDINRKREQRMQDEARIYHRAYQDVERTIASFAQRYGFDLVLQYSTAEIDPNKPDTVIRGLNRLVVYQDRLNITKYVLDELNRAAPAAPAGVTAPNRPAAGVRTATPPAVPGTPIRK